MGKNHLELSDIFAKMRKKISQGGILKSSQFYHTNFERFFKDFEKF